MCWYWTMSLCLGNVLVFCNERLILSKEALIEKQNTAHVPELPELYSKSIFTSPLKHHGKQEKLKIKIWHLNTGITGMSLALKRKLLEINYIN